MAGAASISEGDTRKGKATPSAAERPGGDRMNGRRPSGLWPTGSSAQAGALAKRDVTAVLAGLVGQTRQARPSTDTHQPRRQA